MSKSKQQESDDPLWFKRTSTREFISPKTNHVQFVCCHSDGYLNIDRIISINLHTFEMILFLNEIKIKSFVFVFVVCIGIGIAAVHVHETQIPYSIQHVEFEKDTISMMILQNYFVSLHFFGLYSGHP